VAQVSSAASPGETRRGAGGDAPVTGSRRVTAVAWVLVTAVSLARAVLTVLASGDLVTSDTISNFAAAPAAVLYATLGTLVVRRAGNVIGWILLGIGAGNAIMGSASAYAVLGITHPGTLPAPALVGLLAEWTFVPVFAALGFMLLLFPSGTLPSPRWRPFAALALLATALAMAGFVLHPRLIAVPAPGGEGSLAVANPLGVRSLGPVLSTVLIGTLNRLAVLGTVLLAAAFVSLVIRYRSARGAPADQVDHAGGGGARCLLGRGAAGHRGHRDRVKPGDDRRLSRDTDHRAVQDSRAHHGGDLEARPVRDRCHHQPRHRLRPALGGADGGLRADRGGDRDAGGVRGRAAAQRGGGAGGRGAVPAAAPPGAAFGEPGRVRAAGHAVPGARRLRAGHGRAAGRRRGTGPDGVGAGRGHRRGPGGSLGPGRRTAAPAGDLATRSCTARRCPAHRCWRAAGARCDAGRRGPAYR
jgi:hypothetical protein